MSLTGWCVCGAPARTVAGAVAFPTRPQGMGIRMMTIGKRNAPPWTVSPKVTRWDATRGRVVTEDGPDFEVGRQETMKRLRERAGRCRAQSLDASVEGIREAFAAWISQLANVAVPTGDYRSAAGALELAVVNLLRDDEAQQGGKYEAVAVALGSAMGNAHAAVSSLVEEDMRTLYLAVAHRYVLDAGQARWKAEADGRA